VVTKRWPPEQAANTISYNIVARRDSSGASPVVITHCQTLAGAVGVTLLSLTGSAT